MDPRRWYSQFLEQNASSSTLLVTLGALLAAAVWRLYRLIVSITQARRPNLPVYKVVTNDVDSVLEKAHREHPESPFMLSLPGMEMAVLPPSEIETIRALPESDVSIKRHHYDVFLGEYTYMGTKADEFDNAMRYVLTRNTAAVLESFVDEVQHALDQQIGACEDWIAVKPRYAMSRVASLLSGRAFVGLPLSREKAWVEATVNYTQDVSRAWMVLKLIPQPIRFFVAPFLPAVRSLKNHRAVNEQMLAPLLRQRRAADRAAAREQEASGGNMIDWFISQYKTPPTIQQLGRDQLLATFASIYNLSNALSYIVFDLAASRPEDVQAMREEVLQVVGPDGSIDKNALVKLKKLDSFAKESQRLSPPSLVNIPRIVTNPRGLRLSTGHVLPAGTRLTINSHAINQNPAIYPDPAEFKPFRFAALRELPGNELRYQHASTGLDNINFGHGLWACPGRFFANAEIKVVLATLLLKYDVKLKPGTQKPPQQHFGLAILPDATAEVVFRARKY